MEKKSRQLSALHMQMQRRGRRNNAPHYVVLILQPSPHLKQIGCGQLCSFLKVNSEKNPNSFHRVQAPHRGRWTQSCCRAQRSSRMAEDGAALPQLGLFNLARRSFGLSSGKCLKRGDKKDPKSMGWFGLERP